MNCDARIPSKSPLPTYTRTVHLAVLLLSLCGILSISGCTGVASTPKSSNQQTQNSSTPAAAISIAPASLTFGSVAIGGTVSQSVTVSNGGGSDLTVTQASTSASGIAITGASFPMTIAAGSQSNFNIVFTPKVSGAVTGAITVMSNASTSPSSVSVSGTGVAAATLLNASAAALSFGSVNVGTSSTQTVTLSNAGNSNVTISSVTLAGTNATASGVAAGLILSPSQSATLTVVYSPTTAGSWAGNVTVASNASNSPDSISLSGTGVQAASHSVTLSWAPSTSAVEGYNVYRSGVASGPYTRQNSSVLAAMAFTDTTVQSGQTYYYEVTAVSPQGVESSDSTDVPATIP